MVTGIDKSTNENGQHEREERIRDSIGQAEKYRETTEEAIKRLAELSQLQYDHCRKAEAAKLGVRAVTLDEEISRARQAAKLKLFERSNANIDFSTGASSSDCSNDSSKPTKANTDEELAREIMEAENPIDLVEKVIPKLGYAGDVTPVKLAYVAVSSRLLSRPLNVQFDAQSASGKNFTVDTALKLHPPEAYYKFSASSPRALIYTMESFKHKTVVIEEADSIPNEGPAASAIRSLVHEGKMVYETVERNPESGQFETRRIEKQGPTGLLTTGIRAMDSQMSTRVLSASVPDTADQTRAIMRAKAKTDTDGDETMPDGEIEKFRAHQRWLAAKGEKRIAVPFARALAELVPADQVRMRRDFPQLLSVIKTLAMLAQRRRTRDRAGRVVATLDDYQRAKLLLAAVFESVVADGITRAVRETVEAINEGEEVSEVQLTARLNLVKSTINYRVRRAMKGCWLSNLESRKGYPARLVRGAPLPAVLSALPTREDIEAKMIELEPYSNGGSNSDETTGGEALGGDVFECSTPLPRYGAADEKAGDEVEMEDTTI